MNISYSRKKTVPMQQKTRRGAFIVLAVITSLMYALVRDRQGIFGFKRIVDRAERRLS